MVTSLRVRRVGPAGPAVLVATRLIGLLGRARQVYFERADDDLIILRVGPEIGQHPDARWPGQLLEEVQYLLREASFAGWEPESP